MPGNTTTNTDSPNATTHATSKTPIISPIAIPFKRDIEQPPVTGVSRDRFPDGPTELLRK